MIHKEMTDSQWNTIVKHLPKPAKTGRPRCNDRITINGILFVLSVGCRWEEIAAQYGSKSTAHLRFSELQQKGIWKKILSGLIKVIPTHLEQITKNIFKLFMPKLCLRLIPSNWQIV